MYDVLIIGCGVTGAATAYTLARYDLKVGIIERFNDVACATTKANSAIMHAGYDPKPESRMAPLNRRGIALAKEICDKLHVEYKPMQSLVIAFNEHDMKEVNALYERGLKNGVNVKVLDHDELMKVEPAINPAAIGALWSDDSAIINPWEFATAMAEVAVLNGAELMLSTKVEDIKKNADSLTVVTDKGELQTRYVINAAGCHSAAIAKMVGDDRLTQTNMSGQYFVLDKAEGAKVNSVIFRCPDENGFKGILVSPTVHGNLIVGPDANPARDGDDVRTTSDILAMLKERGLESVPSINYRNIIRQYAGVRPTTQTKDFTIDVSPACERMINLAGMCSPGLSSAPAVGEEAARLLSTAGLELNAKESFKDERPPVVHLASMSADEKRALIAKNPAYGKIICRCETVTEGEIVDAIRRPITPRSIDAVKRRCRAGMGRCQGGFCSPRVHELISRELGIPMEEIPLDKDGSFIITGKTKA